MLEVKITPLGKSTRGRHVQVAILESSTAGRKAILRDGNSVTAYDPATGRIIWERHLQSSTRSTVNYPIWPIRSKGRDDVLAIRQHEGFQLYDQSMQLLAVDGLFHDAYHWADVQAGRIYPGGETRLLTRDRLGSVKLYGPVWKRIVANQTYPLLPMKKTLPAWQNVSDFYLADVDGREMESIIARTSTGLEYYAFLAESALSLLANFTRPAEPGGRLFFANITLAKYKDVLHLNESGLFFYRYDDQLVDYMPINHHAGFSAARGWRRSFDNSIRLLDVNLDLHEDLLFSGQDGLTALTFDLEESLWRIIIDPLQLSPELRYLNPIGVLPKSQLLLQNSDLGLDIGKFVPSSQSQIKTHNDDLIATIPDDITYVISKHPEEISIVPSAKPILRWTEQWDLGFLKEPISQADGGVNFKIPMIDVVLTPELGIQLVLEYDSRNTNADLFGVGWSMTIGQDFITVDRKGSIYEEDSVYYLSSIYGKIPMEKIDDAFKMTSVFQDATITYNKEKELWNIETSSGRSTYGHCGADGAIKWSLGWSHWRGIGRNTADLQPLATSWYLCEKRSKHTGQSLFYTYEYDEKAISDKKYTSAVRLKRIYDALGNDVNFKYGSKTSTEYEPNTPGEFFQFPFALDSGHYISGYSVDTISYRQEIKFIYEIEGNNRILVQMQQPVFEKNETILKLNYNQKRMMTGCNLPNGLSLLLNYDQPPPIQHPNTHPVDYPINDHAPAVVRGGNYTVVGSQGLGKVSLLILNQASTSVEAEKSVVPGGAYSIRAFQDYFAVNLDAGRKMCLFHRQGGHWSEIEMCKQVGIFKLYDLNAVVFVKGLSIVILELDDGAWKEILLPLPSGRKPISLAMADGLIAAYDDRSLFVFYRSGKIEWKSKELKNVPSNWTTQIRQTLETFDLKTEFHQLILDYFFQMALQISKNQIVLSTIELKPPSYMLKLRVRTMLLDSNHDIAKTEEYIVRNMDILNMKVEKNLPGGTFNFKYNLIGSRIKLAVYGFSGEIDNDFQKIKNRNLREDARNDYIKEINEGKAWDEYLRSNFLMDLNLFSVVTNQMGVLCDKDWALYVTGAGWSQESPKTEFPLGSSFVIKSLPNSSSLNLYKIEKGVSTFVKTFGEKFINAYPAFLAHQLKSGAVEVVTFLDDKTIGPVRNYENERLIHGDHGGIFTVRNNSLGIYSESHLLKMHPLASILGDRRQAVVTQSTSKDDQAIKRITIYERSAKYVGNVYSETVAVVPGTNKKLSGWQEQTTEYQKDGTPKVTKRMFDGSGELVNPMSETKDDPEEKEDESNVDSMVWDYSGEWSISNFSPYKLKDESVAYYGFELYEKNQIGVEKRWNFNDTDVIEGGFAYTGKWYLRLQGEAKFEGLFKPRFQDDVYVASCWLKSDSPPPTNSPVPYFKVIVMMDDGSKLAGLVAKIKRHDGLWSYLEIIVDFSLIRTMYEKKIELEQSIPEQNPTFNLKIQVLASEAYGGIDLDHIRFSPIGHNFEATSFDPATGKQTSTILNNGLVRRSVYDRFHRNIASVTVNNHVEKVLTSTKVGKLVPPTQGICDRANKLIFEPEYGFIENFDKSTWNLRWIMKENEGWAVANNQLWHNRSHSDRIESRPSTFQANSAALRFFFALNSPGAKISLLWNQISIILDYSAIKLGDITIAPSPRSGELIVLVEKQRYVMWLDSVLLIDKMLETSSVDPWSSFSIDIEGDVLIEHLIVMNKPRLRVEYVNPWGDTAQVLVLENERSVIVEQTVFDSLGRHAIKTRKTRVTRNPEESLLAYHYDFIGKSNPDDRDSVWFTGHLGGTVESINAKDERFPYFRTIFNDNPLNEKRIVGSPGKQYSINGPFAMRFSRHGDVDFVNNHFPQKLGYRHNIQMYPNGSQKFDVFDRKNNLVARYVRVVGFDHILSTYEYDDKGQLVKILPPLYHQRVKTHFKTDEWRPGDDHLTEDERKQQNELAIRLTYDINGQLIKKVTPDAGAVEYAYTPNGQVRFMITDEQVVFYEYDNRDRMTHSGYFSMANVSKNITTLETISQSPEAVHFQLFDYTNAYFEPIHRDNIRRIITYSSDEPVVEELHFNDQQEISSKTTISTPAISDMSDFENILKTDYKAGLLSTLTYPVYVKGRPFELEYTYDKLGLLSGLGVAGDPYYYANFTYTPDGQIASETSMGYYRSYEYNSAGLLGRLSDEFLSEELHYTEGGYGQVGFGDGIVMRTTFKASWAQNSDGKLFQIDENPLPENSNSELCYRALQRTGYLSNAGKPIRLFLPEKELNIPVQCKGNTGKLLAGLIAEKLLPNHYGHAYSYGNHRELIKAKFFADTESSNMGPLQPRSFTKTLSTEESNRLWKSLTDAEYIYSDNVRNDFSAAIGKRGKSFLRDDELKSDLAKLSDGFEPFFETVKSLIVTCIIQKKSVTEIEFENLFLQWMGLQDEFNVSPARNNIEQNRAVTLHGMLTRNGYLSNKALLPEFVDMLNNRTELIPAAVSILEQHFTNAVGETAFDVESYEIDSNGNHRRFYAGFDRFQLEYENSGNRIRSIIVHGPRTPAAGQTFEVHHDPRGNVIRAMHRGIVHIDYHPVSQRAVKIRMEDGRLLRFAYDGQGERVLKQTFDGDGRLELEVQYVRDERGRVLMDRRIAYHASPLPADELLTVYLYGPRGLHGFIRDGEFYKVVTDHAGSVRLVLRGDTVVAAFDYLPYGQLMRRYGANPDFQINYRYTGQEYDPETGLYNYHARLYDPSTGRFLQPDPQAQYFSPYKYAGNSPVSLVDPNGELATLVIVLIIATITTTAVGAYVGGAAANNRWNPADWDWSDQGTYLGIGGGVVSGAFLPGSLVAAGPVGAIFAVRAGLGVAFLSVASLDNVRWDRPATWNALFQGFSTGVGLVSGVKMAHSFARTIQSVRTARTFLGISYAAGLGNMYVHGAGANNWEWAPWKWDYTKPNTFLEMVNGFDTGFGIVHNVAELASVAKMFKLRPEKLAGMMSPHTKTWRAFLKNPRNPLYQTAFAVLGAYYMGSQANGNFELDWSNKYSTYEAVLTGAFFGRDMSRLMRKANSRITGKPPPKRSRDGRQLSAWRNKIHHVIVVLVNRLKAHMRSKKGGDVSGLVRDTLIKGDIKETAIVLVGLKTKESIRKNLMEIEQLNREAANALEARNKVDLDESVMFLSCGGRRRRRHLGTSACSTSSNTEAIESFVDGEVSTEVYLNRVISDTPKHPSSTSKEFFYLNFLTGAAGATADGTAHRVFHIERTSNAALDGVTVKEFLFHSKGKTRWNRIIEFHDITNDIAIENTLNSAKETRLSGDSLIKNNIPKDNVEGSLVVIKKLEDGKRQVMVEKLEPNQIYENPGESSKSVETYTEINVADQKKVLDMQLDEFSKVQDIKMKLRAMERYCKGTLEMYNKLKEFKLFGDTDPSKKNPEREFHAFFYGVLEMNFKQKYNIDVHVERISGKGQVDVMFKFGDDWNSVPVVVELKSDVRNGAEVAISQVEDKGYLYNLPMKTIAKDVIVIGVDSSPTGGVEVKRVDMPKTPELLEAILMPPKGKHVKAELKRQFGGMYNSFSNMANKAQGTNNYMSNMIIGNILASKDVISECHVRKTDNLEHDYTSILMKNKKGQWFLLNLSESVDVNIPEKVVIPNVDIGTNLIRIDLQIDSINNKGWEPGFKKDNVFQNLDVKVGTEDAKVTKVDDNYIKVEMTKVLQKDFKDILKTADSFEKGAKQLKGRINSEANFQSLFHGYLMGHQRLFAKKNKIIRVFPESNLSTVGRTDLIVSVLEQVDNVVTEHSLTAIETKYKFNRQKKPIDSSDLTRSASQHILSKVDINQVDKYENYQAISNLKNMDKLTFGVEKVMGKNFEKDKSDIVYDFQSMKREAVNIDLDMDLLESSNLPSNFKKTRYDNDRSKRSIFNSWPVYNLQLLKDEAGTSGVQCIRGIYVAGEGYVDGFTCSLPSSIIRVFSLSEIVSGDTYSRSSCRPLEYEGRPSLYCEGGSTTVVYSPLPKPGLFDQLDGQLMLGRVLIELGLKAWASLTSRNENQRESEKITLDDSRKMRWCEASARLHKTIERLADNLGEEHLSWSRPLLDDCEEEIDRLSSNHRTDERDIAVLEEQLQALQEDLNELEMDYGDMMKESVPHQQTPDCSKTFEQHYNVSSLLSLIGKNISQTVIGVPSLTERFKIH